MYSSSPAKIVLIEFGNSSVQTSHHRDGRELIRSLLRHRDYFKLVADEFAEAKAIWDAETIADALADAETMAHRKIIGA